ncbi:hypothetical protein F01_480081 [Burkholderia cenocepacia]|nr:hypothetical protein F01_480081 [Burkholderia cenocepacia]
MHATRHASVRETHHGSGGTESRAGGHRHFHHAGRHCRGDPRIAVRSDRCGEIRGGRDCGGRHDRRDRAQHLADRSALTSVAETVPDAAQIRRNARRNDAHRNFCVPRETV